PVTQGHEVSGEIVKLGKDAGNFYVGQKVTIQPQVVCGECYPCRHGKYNLCEKLKVMGFQTTGMASEYFVADIDRVTPLPNNLSFDEGAMIEPLAVAVHAVKQFGDISEKQVAVLGAGPIGILVAQAAKALGAKAVLITDISDLRLQKAQECGVDFVVNTKAENFGEAIGHCFGPDKADVIYDCAGNDLTMGQAIEYGRKGSTIILVAVFAHMASLNLAVLNDKELSLNSSMMYRNEDYLEGIALVSAEKIQLKPLISAHFAFQDYGKAYAFIDTHRESTMKIIIDIG
ncbi:MAG: zinc-binding dehydrogenase, partial [Oscillospiraceae bacterium]